MEGHGTENVTSEYTRRVDYLEGEVSGLKTSVASIDQKMGFIDRKLTAQETRSMHSDQVLTDIAAKLDGVRSQKTDWGMLATWATVAIVVSGAVLAPLYQDTMENKTEIKTIKETRWSRVDDQQVMKNHKDNITAVIEDIRENQRRQDDRIRGIETRRNQEP